MKNLKLIFFVALGCIGFFFLNSNAHSEESAGDHRFQFTLIDGPFNWAYGYAWPSMQQSLETTKSVYEAAHYALIEKALPTHPIWARLSAIGFDIFMGSFPVPLGSVWLHEEWHRAVLSRRGIHSFNGVYDFDFAANEIPVRAVKDSDLINLKLYHPAEQVRLSAAGFEAQYQLNLEMEKQEFFEQTPNSYFDPVILLNDLSNTLYYGQCIYGGTDTTAQTEGANPSKRDFTGLDCNAWVYDLDRPDEPYQARGVHPSGVGINRYINFSQLNSKEQRFLKLQFGLSFLNLLDPFVLGFDEFQSRDPVTGEAARWNLNLRHELTSFGYTIEPQLFWNEGRWKWLFIFHNYANDRMYFPGLDFELRDFPIARGWYFSPRVIGWLQPKNQRFDQSSATAGGLLRIRFDYQALSWLRPFAEFEAKTEGWVAGNVYLDKNLSIRAGLTALLY